MKFLLIFLLPLLGFAESVDRIVAVVNDEVILESDFTRLQKKANKPMLIEEILLGGRSISDLKKNRELQLEYLLNEKLLDSEVKRLNLTASPDRIDQEINQMAQRYRTTRDEIMKAAKADMGFTTEEYRRFLKTQIERQSLIETEVSRTVHVSDEEVYAEYKKRNPHHKRIISEVTLAHIFFNPKKGGLSKARERAEQALARIRRGDTFEVVAEQTSEDPQFANNGLLGTFKSGELVPEFEKSIADLKVGGVSDIVQSKQGIHILKVLDEKAVKDSEFEQQKEKLRAMMMERSFEKQFRSWLSQKREEATISHYLKK